MRPPETAHAYSCRVSCRARRASGASPAAIVWAEVETPPGASDRDVAVTDETFDHETMPEAWRKALEEFIALPLTSPLRQRIMRAAQAIKENLRDIVWRDDLAKRYPYDDQRIARVVSRLFPGERWWVSDLRTPKDLAYALRYVELSTGQYLDATQPLPWWVTEWTRD